ncbi:MAG: hypothetical protein WAM73_20945 [Desulfobacterales bacterium]
MLIVTMEENGGILSVVLKPPMFNQLAHTLRQVLDGNRLTGAD